VLTEQTKRYVPPREFPASSTFSVSIRYNGVVVSMSGMYDLSQWISSLFLQIFSKTYRSEDNNSITFGFQRFVGNPQNCLVATYEGYPRQYSVFRLHYRVSFNADNI
jgi:hypothetical protein